HDAALRALRDLDLVAGFADQIGDVDHRQRVGAMHFEEVTGCDRLQRLTRLQCRQRAFEAGEIELRRGHVSNMEKQAQIVNATAFSSEVDTGSREENASKKIRSGLHRTGTRPSGPARRA